MAKTLPETKFRKEDFPVTGLGTQDVLDKFFLPLNTALKAIRDALNNGLTVGDNMAAEFKTFTLSVPGSGSAFPFNVTTSKVTTPVGVSLVACYDTSSSPAVPSLGLPSWLLNPDRSIKVTNIPGLTAGHTYRLTFKIEGG